MGVTRSPFIGAGIRIGVGLVLTLVGLAMVDDSWSWTSFLGTWLFLVGGGFLGRGGATFVDAAWFRLRGARLVRLVPLDEAWTLEIRDVSAMPRIQGMRVLQSVGLTRHEAKAAADGGTREFSSGLTVRRYAERAARAARRYGAEARAEPVIRSQPVQY